LGSHPDVLHAVHEGVERFGINVAASRLTTGNHPLYRVMEKRLAAFFGAEDAVLIPTGYMTDTVVAQALASSYSHVLIDRASHPALVDASKFLDCPVIEFKHRDPADLARVVARCGPQTKLLVLTDGMFSHDGSAAPLAEYLEVLPKDALLLVDDAHGAGVLGRSGKGAIEHAGVSRRRIIQTVTLSKAFGAYGGAILGTVQLRQRVLNRSQMFVGSTPLPLPLANAALTGVRLLRANPGLRRRLVENAAYVKKALREAGLALAETPGPIVPLVRQRPGEAARLQRALLGAGIFPPFIQYPGGPPNGYFRFVISSEHSRAQLEGLIQVLRRHLATHAGSG